MTVCEGSGVVVLDTALVLGDDPNRYIACPVCFEPFSLPVGGQWAAPTIPDHPPQNTSLAAGDAFDAGVALS